MPVLRSLSALCVCTLGLAALATPAHGQTTNAELRARTVDVSSGVVVNSSDTTAVLFSHVVTLPEANDMQLHFGRTKLAEGCTLRLTSLTDGHMQHHDATTLHQWRNHSAWFNGTMVHVELVAEPGTAASHVTIDSAHWVRRMASPRSICGSTDDRVPSSDPRAARHYPVGCSVWLINDANHTFLSAGHCMDEGVDGHVAEFNVPLSDSNGNINHPGPEDQYAMDPESLQWGYVQIGNDWAYFGCWPNTETGMTPYQAQGASYVLANMPDPVADQDITIIGYGTTSSPINPQWNQIQKTHTGPYAHFEGTVLGYQTDTTGGNSGSAVLDEATGLAIGIHTNAGCGSSGGFNHGCAIHQVDLQNALANPQGVCIPNVLVLSFTDQRPGILPPGTHTMDFAIAEGNEMPVPESVQVGVSTNGGAMNWMSPEALGEGQWRHTWHGLSCDDVHHWQIRATGDGGTDVVWPLSPSMDHWTLHVGELNDVTLLQTSFAKGIPGGWSADGLWHGTSDSCAPSGTCDGSGVAYFGVDGDCSYDTGDTEEGLLLAPEIDLSGIGGDVVLRVCMSLETEDSSSYDIASLEVNGTPVHTFGDTNGWETIDVQLPAISGDILDLGFHFDTGDDLYNDYTGWHINTVSVFAQGIDCDACQGDVTGDGMVSTDDILLIIAHWGQSDSPADADGDGVVNASDILLVLSGWGPC